MRRHERARLALQVALFTTVFGMRAAVASPEDLFGYGASSQAMGMTGAAIGSGYETTYTNPALLSLARERKLSLGYQGAAYDLHANGPQAPGEMSIDGVQGMVIGAMLPLGFGGVLEDRIALGVAFFTPSDVVVRGRILYPEKPQFGVLADRSQSVTIRLGVGADLGYGIRAGAGFGALAAIAGDVLVATNESGQVGTKVDDQLVAAYGPVFGLSYDLGENYRLGATYRGVLEGRFDVVIVVRDLGSLEVPPLNIAGVAQYDPRQVQLEIARVRGDWRAAVGATWRHWSEYSGPPEATVQCPPERPDCTALRTPDFNFHDTLSPRLGVERALKTSESTMLKLRAGYAYEPSPAPEQKREMNFFDNDRHVATLGAAFELARPLVPLSVEAFGQLHQLAERTHRKDADVSPDNAGWPEVKTGGRVFAGGLVVGVEL